MASVTSKSFDTPDETRVPDKSRMEMVDLGTVKAGRLTAEPGWRWSTCVQPLVGGDSCQQRHVGVVVSGRMGIRHDDGTELEIETGDAYVIEPGHDGWVVGDTVMVAYEFDSSAAETYARPA